jgi:electron transport complex protein RnfA
MSFYQLITLSLGAVLAENFISAWLPNAKSTISAGRNVKTAFGMGAAVLFVMTAAAVCTGTVDLVLIRYDVPALRLFVFAVFMAAIIHSAETVLKKTAPSLYTTVKPYMSLLFIHCAVLSIAVGFNGEGTVFLNTVTRAAAAGAAFSIAIILFSSIRERLAFADYPASFKGLPIALTTAALLSVAFFGFHGVIIR